MNLCAATLLCFSLFEPSSARLHNIIADLEDRTCGKSQKQKCSEGGENYVKMKKTLQDVPVLGDFPLSNKEYDLAVQKSKEALTNLATFFNGNNRLTDCKNCVQEDEKKQLCDMKDPIYQGLLDNKDEHLVDVTKAYCPVGHMVCSGIHDKLCNGDWYTDMEKSLETTSKTGEPGAIQAINNLMNFFTTTCKNCVDVAKTINLCDTKKAIVTGIISYDNKDWADPTAKHCNEVREPWYIGEFGESCGQCCRSHGLICDVSKPTTTTAELRDRLQKAGLVNPSIATQGSGSWYTGWGLNPAYSTITREWFLGKVSPTCDAGGKGEDKTRQGLCYCTGNVVMQHRPE